MNNTKGQDRFVHDWAMIYLSLGEVLAVVGTLRDADVVELALELSDVSLDEGETQREGLVGVCRAGERVAGGGSLEGLVELEVAGGGLAQGKGDKGSEEQASSHHWNFRTSRL